ncbi:hypothetical protein JTE90_005408 [Oedothorax gibbosus]|uniref:Ion transport domain-containing protein n=1 Tax=Oedothorax gibbosus TaxID=931172 RepID=A0AAV6U452_9ARAC|nr:hypothetical protein JTE90_005408 [Oedothorax gibbosus]
MSQNNNDKRIQAAEATNIPLAEMDPKVLNETFCIVTKSWGQTFVHRYNKSPSLNLFYPYSAIRRCAMAFTTHVIYDIILFIIVIGNLVDLAIPNSMPLFFERVSLLFYVSEAIHQSLSRGFVVGKYTYLRNPWMCFDFLLTLVSLAYSEGFRKKFFALQSLRGVRILNLVTILPGVRTMAEAVILSIYMMFGMILLFLVSLLFVTITAMHLFQGVLSQKCVKFYYHGVSDSSYADFIEMEENWLKDKEYWYTCGNWTGARHCPDHYMCLPNIKNNYDYIHFEHFGAALLNSLGLITHDDWDLAVDEISKATGPISYFFLAPVIFFGSFCLLNLMVVVVISIYEAMITAKLENSKVLLAYTSYSSFQFDITQIPLYHLPTNEKTLNHIVEQRKDQADHEETVKEYWKKITRAVQLKKKAVLRNVDPVNVHEAEAVSDEKKEGLCSKCRLKVKNFTESKGFQYCITVTIIINSILLASHNANMSDATINLLELGNLICLIIFTLETIIMIMAYGVDYFFNLWNLVDFVIVVSGIAVVLSKAMADIIAFRVLRLLKLMRFQHQWTAMRKITSVILKSMKNIIRLVILMCLLILMFSIIGNRVLGPLYDYENDFNRLRWSFATFEGSTFTVFKIFAGEWIEDLWDCMLKSKNSPFCPVVFVGFYLIGNFVILNLFAALLLTSFDDISLQLADQEDGFLKKMFRRLKKFFVSSCCRKMRNTNNTEITESVERLSSENNQSHETLTNYNSEGILTRAKEFIKSHKFDKIVLAVILLNCVCLALHDSTVKEKSERHKHLYRIDIFCVSFFASEMLLRLFGNGMKQYFTEGWTLFDFFMNMVSVIGIPFHSNTVLRELRSLRAISILSKFQEMKVIVRAFVLSVPAILNVLIVAFFLWLPFGIIGIHFFAGKFYRCADEFNKRVAVSGVYNKTDCYEKGYHWRNAFFNFDHIGNSYQTLMQLALYSGWDDSVLMMVDSKGNDLEPEENYDKSKYIYVVAFILVGGFLCFNLFVGAAVDAFRQKQRRVEGTEIVDTQLTLSQKKYYSAMVKFGKRKPIFFIQPPTNKFLNMFYVISFSIWRNFTPIQRNSDQPIVFHLCLPNSKNI